MNITPGPCLVRYAKYRLSGYGFDIRLQSTKIKSFSNKTWDKMNSLSPRRAWNIANERYFNFIKSMPRLPLNIITPVPNSRDNVSHLIYVK